MNGIATAKSEDMASVSIANGVVKEEVGIEEGPRRGKRKTIKPAIKDESSDDSDTPLVSAFLLASIHELRVWG